jgi:phosphoribosylanthranilate isomerase
VAVETKICGLTRPEDAASAAALGADFLGVVFASGPRVLTSRQAAEIVRAAAGRPVLGVFGAQPVEEILRVRDVTGLRGAQLHGPYSTDDARRLGSHGLLIWRVIRLQAESDLDAIDPTAAAADALLVEPRVDHAGGGAGVCLPIQLAALARSRIRGPMVLAGGLRPETVADAVGLVRPDAVDVSSGVEILPSIKDSKKMARFLEAVRGFSPVA